MGDGEGGEGLGGFDEDIDEGAEATDESTDASESDVSESSTTETSEQSGFGNISSEFGSVEGKDFSTAAIEQENNDHIHGKDSRPENHFSSTRTVTPESINEIGRVSNKSVYEYAAKQSALREKEFTAKSLENKNNIQLVKSSSLPKNALGVHDINTGELRIDDLLSEKAAYHVSNHEGMHGASYQEHSVNETEHQKTEINRSGIHEVTSVTNKDTGEITQSDFGRSLNEGITESRTLEMEKENGFETHISAYSTARGYTAAIESLTGRECINSAYYEGNKESLAARCNELGKSENTWNDINNLMDIISSPSKENITPEAKAQASRELDNILETMNRSRMEEIQNERKND